MFVRKKKNTSGSISIQIIEKINRKNRVLKSIGSSKDPIEVERLFQKGLYELPRLFGATLFDDVKEPQITHHASPITHHPSRITHHPSPITHHSSPITHHSSLITHHP